MTDTKTTKVITYTDTGDHYIYPNDRSVTANRYGVGRAPLARGMIWSMKPRVVEAPLDGYVTGSGGMPYATTVTNIDERVYKKFQYNPAEVQMSMNAVATDTSQSANPGGNLNGIVQGMGALQMDIKLQFTRDQEVYIATNDKVSRTGIGDLSGVVNRDALEVYKRIGVQKDVFDLYRVILSSGNNADNATADAQTQTLPNDMTLSGLTKKAFDLASAGSFLLMQPVAIQINEDAIFYGFISTFNVVYNKFNFNMVPVWAQVSMSLDVTNVRPSTAPPSTVFGGQLTTGGSSGGSGGGQATVTPDPNRFDLKTGVAR
jgi:hypothetical protein